jgi:hypothetical protein
VLQRTLRFLRSAIGTENPPPFSIRASRDGNATKYRFLLSVYLASRYEVSEVSQVSQVYSTVSVFTLVVSIGRWKEAGESTRRETDGETLLQFQSKMEKQNLDSPLPRTLQSFNDKQNFLKNILLKPKKKINK